MSLRTSYERKQPIKLKGEETSAPPDLTEQPAPNVSSTELSPIYRELGDFKSVLRVEELLLWALVFPLFSRRRAEGVGDIFLALSAKEKTTYHAFQYS